MGGQPGQPPNAMPSQPGMPAAAGPGGQQDADEGPDEGPETDTLPTEDLSQFTGAESHRSEPVTPPADADAGHGPAKTDRDPDSQ